MKKNLLIALLFTVLLSGCAHEAQPEQAHSNAPSGNFSFIRNEKLHIVSDSGIAYELLAHEEELYYLGELEYIGSVQGEEGSPSIYGIREPGMYALKAASNDNILIRYAPENEWFFLLDIIYPYEMEYPTDIRLGNLVIGHAPPEDGFSLIKSLPVRDILEGNIKSEEIRQEEKLEYIRNTLPLIPYKELI
jgi:hypothetical protein